MEQTAPFTIDEVAMDVCALYILIFMLQENFVIINITLQGDVVGTIKATDRDEGPFRELNYELEAVFNTTGGQNTQLENYGLELVNGEPDADGFNFAVLLVDGDYAWVDKYVTYTLKVKVGTQTIM